MLGWCGVLLCVTISPSTAGMSAERAAALQGAQKNSPPHFVTKRVADPNMIPMLIAAGVEFGAVKVCCSWPSSQQTCILHILTP